MWAMFTRPLEAGIPVGAGLLACIVYARFSPSNRAKRRMRELDKTFPLVNNLLEKGCILDYGGHGFTQVIDGWDEYDPVSYRAPD
jgi:hypothetical protein